MKKIKVKDKYKLAGFDLDYTLVNANSSYEFVFFCLKKKIKIFRLLRYLVLEIIDRLSIGFVFSRPIKNNYYLLLKGYSKEELNKYSKEFVELRLLKLVNPEILDEFKKSKLNKLETILVSASLDSICKFISRTLDFNYYLGSTLKFDENGLCTGEMQLDLQGEKNFSIESFLTKKKYNPDDLIYFTDNEEDINIVNTVGKLVGVYKEDSQRIYWEKKDIPTLSFTPALRINKWLFLFPSVYYFYTRYPLREIFYVHIPFFILVYLNYSLSENPLLIPLSWLYYISFYEIGYITNDCQKEQGAKSSRVPAYFCSLKPLLFLSRIISVVLLSALIWSQANINLLLLCNIVVLCAFFIHNILSRNLRILTYPFIKTSHLLVPIILVLRAPDVFKVTLVVIIFYTAWESLFYFRKLKNIGDWGPDFRRNLVSIPKLLLLLLLLTLNFVGFVDHRIFLLAFALTTREIFQVAKILFKK